MGSAPANDLTGLLGRGCELRAKLTFAGKVRIDGRFDGRIVTNDVLVIGEEARVTAEISCATLVCRGEVVGDVRATDGVELYRPARLKGNVTTSSLSIEKGVSFDGRSTMECADASGAEVPTPADVTPIGAARRPDASAP